jgi:serine/threonine protein kinase
MRKAWYVETKVMFSRFSNPSEQLYARKKLKVVTQMFSAQLKKEFKKECNVMKKAAHPAIVRLCHSREDRQGHQELYMEYCDGGDLEVEIRSHMSMQKSVLISVEKYGLS